MTQQGIKDIRIFKQMGCGNLGYILEVTEWSQHIDQAFHLPETIIHTSKYYHSPQEAFRRLKEMFPTNGVEVEDMEEWSSNTIAIGWRWPSQKSDISDSTPMSAEERRKIEREVAHPRLN